MPTNADIKLAARQLELDRERERLKSEAECIIKTLTYFIEALECFGVTNRINTHLGGHQFKGRAGPVEFPTNTSEILTDIFKLKIDQDTLEHDKGASLHQ